MVSRRKKEPSMPTPFGEIVARAFEARQRDQPTIKAELDALEKIVLLMEGADDDTRRRIMAYLNSRYPFGWARV